MATNIFPTDNTSEQVKSYWNRPGGKFGTIIGLGILGVIGYKLLPVLTAIVWNTHRLRTDDSPNYTFIKLRLAVGILLRV